MKALSIKGLAILVLSGLGCAVYQPKPLIPESVLAGLDTISIEDSSDARYAKTADQKPLSNKGSLSLVDAASIAVVLNPSLRELRNNRGIAKAQLLEAGLLPNPEFELRGLSSTKSLSGVAEINTTFDFSEAFIKREPRKKAAKLELEKVKWEIAEQEWQIAALAKEKYFQILYLKEALELNQKLKEIAHGIYKNVETRKARGAASALDAILAESEVFDAERELKMLSSEYASTLIDFNTILGLPPTQKVNIILDQQLFDREPHLGTEQRDIEVLMQCNPELRKLQDEYLISEAELEIAHSLQFPRIDFGPSFEGGRGESQVGFQLGVSIPVFNKGQGQIAIGTAKRQKHFATYVAKLHQARSQYLIARSRVVKIAEEVNYYSATVLPHLESIVNLSKSAYEQGEMELIPFLVQQNKLLTSRREILSRLKDFQTQKIALLLARGPDCFSQEH